MNNVLVVESLTKSFDKNKMVLNNLSFAIPEGAAFGFLGKNGAGKTTAMRIIVGLIKPNSGSVIFDGTPLSFGKPFQRIGYLSDSPSFYNYMSVYKYLIFLSELCGIEGAEARKNAQRLIEITALDDFSDKNIKALSRGNAQRLGIAQALVHSPKLLICDEPTSALDPTGRRQILDVLLRIKQKTTILFSTHILSDVENICDYVGILHKGSLAVCSPLEELLSSAPIRSRSIVLGFSQSFDRLSAVSDALVNIDKKLSPAIRGNTIELITPDKREIIDSVLLYITQNKLPLELFKLNDSPLESVFLEVTQ